MKLPELLFVVFCILWFTNHFKPAHLEDPTTVRIDDNHPKQRLSPYLNGTNANPFSGQMVDQPELITHIKNLNPRIIRFPGGDISSLYFWNRDKWHPPHDVPKELFLSRVKAKAELWYGLNDEPWTLSLENYYKLLRQTNTTGMITVNYGYARYGTGPSPLDSAAHLAADWVRHDNGRTELWEVGNESYGYWEAGWKIERQDTARAEDVMNGGIYGRHFKVFADSMRKAAREIGKPIRIGAQLIANPTDSKANPAEEHWNKRYFEAAGDAADYYIIHDYFTPFGEDNNAREILKSARERVGAAKQYLTKSFAESNQLEKPIAMTEWNIFSVGSKQKISAIAGMHAVIALGEMHKANFEMAMRWGLLGKYDKGNDFGTISIGDEPGNANKWKPWPVFYYLYFYQKMLGERRLETLVTGSNDIVAYASKTLSKAVSATIANTGEVSKEVIVKFNNKSLERCHSYLLTASDNSPFARKILINGHGTEGISGGPADYLTIPAKTALILNNGVSYKIPPYGVLFLIADVI